MTPRIKKLCLVTGLAVCVALAWITRSEVNIKTGCIANKTHAVVDQSNVSHSIISIGSKWIIQTTYKFLKTN